MKYSIVKPAELDRGLVSRWDELQRLDDRLASPYFRPEFTIAVGAVRSDARVAVIEDGGRVVAFFPFQVGRFQIGRPIGGPLSDFHGVIGEQELELPAGDLLRGSGLAVWEFDHLLATGSHIAGTTGESSGSPVMDLRDGYEAYCQERRASGSEQIKKNGTLARKLDREHGPIEFRMRDADTTALRHVMAWKSRQCVETGTTDVFGVAWTRELLERLHAMHEQGFSGVLSTLRVGDRVVAAHFGMRSAARLHYWFPGYEHEFAKYSPGLVLLLRMAEGAPNEGMTAIDLGKGESFYKSRLANAEVPLLEGRIESVSLAASAKSVMRRAEQWVDSGPLARTIGLPIRAWRRRQRLRKYA